MRPWTDPGHLGTLLRAVPVVGIVRSADEEVAVETGMRLLDRGIRAVEVSLTTPGALSAITRLAASGTVGAMVGVGTVRTVDELEGSVAAGAQFIVTPTVMPAVVAAAAVARIPSIVGACTPTEVQVAIEAGASLVKLFPASQWSLNAFRDLRAVFAEVPFVPTGGVRLADAVDWLGAGAAAVGLGSALSDPDTDVPGLLAALARVHGERGTS